MQISNLLKCLLCWNVICWIFIIPVLIMQRKDTFFSSIAITDLLNSAVSSVVDSPKSYRINASFRKELIEQRLTNYVRLFENSSVECDISRPLEAEQKNSLFTISDLLYELRQEIVPYPNDYFHGRGIVLTVGTRQIRNAGINLKMIEASGTRLPVQIWYSSSEVIHTVMTSLLSIAPKVNSSACCYETHECTSLTKSWRLNRTHIYEPDVNNLFKHFPYKPASIISSTFAEVLFLDCDAYVTRDPEELFSDPMYLKFGALFYPDAHQSRQHPLLWQLLNVSCIQDEYELDSATILVNKKRVWKGLYLTKLINDNHMLFYNPMYLTDGDKDTFRIGFRYMNVKYYTVMIPCATGLLNGTRFCGGTLCKTDSLGQHIYVNHIHIYKYERTRYTTRSLGYTRISLGDLSDNSMHFIHCRLPGASTSCIHIVNKSYSHEIKDGCYTGRIPPEEMEDHKYTINQPLLYNQSRKNRLFLSKTDNLMPNFLDTLLKDLW